VALCEDGRLVQRKAVYAESLRKGSSRLGGFSIYTFENGDTSTMKIKGLWNDDAFSADYTVVTGSGVYEGASGPGQLSTEATPESLERVIFAALWRDCLPTLNCSKALPLS
jgi:hypothetical protein